RGQPVRVRGCLCRPAARRLGDAPDASVLPARGPRRERARGHRSRPEERRASPRRARGGSSARARTPGGPLATPARRASQEDLMLTMLRRRGWVVPLAVVTAALIAYAVASMRQASYRAEGVAVVVANAQLTPDQANR